MGFNSAFKGLIKPRRIRWAGHVARMGTGKVNTSVLWGNLRERSHLDDRSVEERIIFEWIFKKF
jgi:hypothetical protein